MDINDIRGFATVLVMIAFLGVCWWAFSLHPVSYPLAKLVLFFSLLCVGLLINLFLQLLFIFPVFSNL